MAPTIHPLQGTITGASLAAGHPSSIEISKSTVKDRRDADCATWNCYSSSTRLGIILSVVMISVALVWMYWHLVIRPRRNQEPIVGYELHAVGVDPSRENSADRASFPPYRYENGQLRASPSRYFQARPVSWWSTPQPVYHQPIFLQPVGVPVFPPPPPPPPGTYTAPNLHGQPQQSHDSCPPVAPLSNHRQPPLNIPHSQTHPQMYRASEVFHTRKPQSFRLPSPGQVATVDGSEAESGQSHRSETVAQRRQQEPLANLESDLQLYKTPTTCKRMSADDISPSKSNNQEERRCRRRDVRFSRQLSISPLQQPQHRLRRTRIRIETSPRADRNSAMEPRRRPRSQARHRQSNQRAQRSAAATHHGREDEMPGRRDELNHRSRNGFSIRGVLSALLSPAVSAFYHLAVQQDDRVQHQDQGDDQRGRQRTRRQRNRSPSDHRSDARPRRRPSSRTPDNTNYLASRRNTIDTQPESEIFLVPRSDVATVSHQSDVAEDYNDPPASIRRQQDPNFGRSTFAERSQARREERRNSTVSFWRFRGSDEQL